jgi:DNA-binding response OmpR family regulator
MSRRHVLVVDDSRFTAEAVAWALRRAGLDVTVASDLRNLDGPLVRPDLVLMDVVLQDAFGDEVAQMLRKRRGFACPILLLSGLPEGELAQRAAEAGLDGYIGKSRGLAAVVERVRRELAAGTAAPVAEIELASRFNVNAHQRLRRVAQLAAHPNLPAIAAEMHALAGDADLIGKAGIADAARACRDTARSATSSSIELDDAREHLGRLVGDREQVVGRLLVLDATDYCGSHLIGELDWRGYVVVEARALADARPIMRPADYDLVLIEEHLLQEEPALVPDLRRSLPFTPIAVAGSAASASVDAVLSKQLGPRRLIDAIDQLLGR